MFFLFSVPPGQCIPLDWQCDGEMDCPEGLDEWDKICSKCLTTNNVAEIIKFVTKFKQVHG